MHVLIAPDSFKGSLSAYDAAKAIQEGFQEGFPKVTTTLAPMADGGEGTLDALLGGLQGKRIACSVQDPLGQRIEAHYGLVHDGKTAVIEMAQAAGYSFIPHHMATLQKASTFGVGELIVDALEQGAEKILIALGGSATVDGGLGALAALGARFYDAGGNLVLPLPENIGHIATLDRQHLHPRVDKVAFTLACDVDNPLLGSKGAVAVYGPQKGATADDLPLLEGRLAHLAHIFVQAGGQEVSSLPGSGAGGGLGLPFASLYGATLEPGALLVAKTLHLDKLCEHADLVITGEGELNAQTLQGKAPFRVATLAKGYHLPVIALVGTLGPGYEALLGRGIDAVYSLAKSSISKEECLQQAYPLLCALARQVAATLHRAHLESIHAKKT